MDVHILFMSLKFLSIDLINIVNIFSIISLKPSNNLEDSDLIGSF